MLGKFTNLRRLRQVLKQELAASYRHTIAMCILSAVRWMFAHGVRTTQSRIVQMMMVLRYGTEDAWNAVLVLERRGQK
jgi:hypothetical protein